MMINNYERTEKSPIRFVIMRVISKIDLLITSCIKSCTKVVQIYDISYLSRRFHVFVVFILHNFSSLDCRHFLPHLLPSFPASHHFDSSLM